MNAPDAASVQRNVVLRVNSGRRTKDEPLAADAMNYRLLVRCIDLSSQTAHMHVNKIALRHEFIIPYLLKKHGTGQQLILSAHHVFKQAKLAWQQINGRAPRLAVRSIRSNFDGPNTQCGLARFRRPA